MKKGNQTAFLILFLAALLYIAKNPTILGLPISLSSDLISLIPGLIVTFFSFKAYRDSKNSLAVFMIGIGLALFLGELNDLSLITDELKNGLTIAQIQTWTVAIGGVLAGLDYFT